MINGHQILMHTLKAMHQPLLDLIGDNSVDYFDIPAYGNVGDILISVGFLSFVSENGLNLKSLSSVYSYIDKKSDAVIVFQGGGNFGDIYPIHQNFREHVISDNLHRRIIVLPQTLHFLDKKNLERSRKIFSAHPDLHLFVRDEKSLALAQGFSPHIALMPDMAHQLYPLKPDPAVDRCVQGTLYFKRKDQESAVMGDSAFASALGLDWVDVLGEKRLREIRCYQKDARLLSRLKLLSVSQAYLARRWERIARDIVATAVSVFAKHERIVTDRLHGHLLAMLLDKNHEVFDNSYGKNFSYVQRWTASSPLVSKQMPEGGGVDE